MPNFHVLILSVSNVLNFGHNHQQNAHIAEKNMIESLNTTDKSLELSPNNLFSKIQMITYTIHAMYVAPSMIYLCFFSVTHARTSVATSIVTQELYELSPMSGYVHFVR
jgi:hypothetical protein